MGYMVGPWPETCSRSRAVGQPASLVPWHSQCTLQASFKLVSGSSSGSMPTEQQVEASLRWRALCSRQTLPPCSLDPLLPAWQLGPAAASNGFGSAGRHTFLCVLGMCNHGAHADCRVCCSCWCMCVFNRCVTLGPATCRHCRCCVLPRSVGCTPSQASCWGWGRQVREGEVLRGFWRARVLLCAEGWLVGASLHAS